MKTVKPLDRENIKKAAKFLLNSKNTIVLTGAGISTESGITDFRGEDDIWEKYQPEIYGDIQTLIILNKVLHEMDPDKSNYYLKWP